MIDRPLYVDKIMAYVDTPFVKILTGVRRCGKSTILKMIMERLKTERNIPEDRIISCRFDSMEYEDMTAKQIYTLLKEKLSPAGKTYLFLDEVQEIKGWEKIVNSLASDFDVDLYITGSNSRMMSSEIATYLTGRYVSFRIFTLSFGEYLMFKSKFANVGEPKTELANYVRLGGFPATHLQAYSQDEIYTIVRDIYNSTIFSDIVKCRFNEQLHTYFVLYFSYNSRFSILIFLKKEPCAHLSIIASAVMCSFRYAKLLAKITKRVTAEIIHLSGSLQGALPINFW